MHFEVAVLWPTSGSVPWSNYLHILTSQYVKNHLFDYLQLMHTTPPGGLAVHFGVHVLWPIGSVLWPN